MRNRSSLILLNLYNIGSEIWRRSVKDCSLLFQVKLGSVRKKMEEGEKERALGKTHSNQGELSLLWENFNFCDNLQDFLAVKYLFRTSSNFWEPFCKIEWCNDFILNMLD